MVNMSLNLPTLQNLFEYKNPMKKKTLFQHQIQNSRTERKNFIMLIPIAIVLIASPGLHCACANMRKLLKYLASNSLCGAKLIIISK